MFSIFTFIYIILTLFAYFLVCHAYIFLHFLMLISRQKGQCVQSCLSSFNCGYHSWDIWTLTRSVAKWVMDLIIMHLSDTICLCNPICSPLSTRARLQHSAHMARLNRELVMIRAVVSPSLRHRIHILCNPTKPLETSLYIGQSLFQQTGYTGVRLQWAIVSRWLISE